MELSVIIPAFNEEQALEETVCCVDRLLRAADLSFEIVIVDDGSTDSTLTKALAIARKTPSCQVLSYRGNRGKGYALKQGFSAASGELVAFLDADGEISPSELPRFVQHQRTTGVSAIVGHKIFCDPRPIDRQLMAWGARVFARLVGLPVADSQAGVKLLLRSEFDELVRSCTEDGYLFDLEMLALANRRGLRITELSIRTRVLRPSRITLRTGVANLGRALSLWLRLSATPESTGREPPRSLPGMLAVDRLTLSAQQEKRGY